jgi:Cu(I)/Ag(I) efflux system protein CusF
MSQAKRLTMRKLYYVIATILALAGVAFASGAFAQTALVDGTVMKVDASAGKMTIRHGPIKKLNMDEGMTMVFRVQDPAMLKAVKAGDRIRFDADKIDGQFTVTRIEKAR